MRKILSFILLLTLFANLSGCATGSPNAQVTTSNPPSANTQPSQSVSTVPQQTESLVDPADLPDKIICTDTIDSSFVDNAIIICVYTPWNDKEYTVDDFKEIGCISVMEIFSADQSGKPTRMLYLELDQHSKQNVLDCIRILEQRIDIYIASPDHIWTLD